MTKREAEALDHAKRVLLRAENAAALTVADRLLQVADRWLAIADRAKS